MLQLKKTLFERFSAAAAVFLICCAAVFYCTVQYGIGLTPDSATYLSVAKSLRDSGKLTDYTGTVSSHFPPGYSAILSAGSVVTGRDVRHGTPRLVSAVMWGLLVAATYILVSSIGLSPPATSACVLAVAFHPGLFQYSLYALSDLPLVSMICLSSLSLEVWHRTERRRWLYLAAGFAATGCLCRYAGVVWPLCAALGVVSNGRIRTVPSRLRLAGSFLTISWAPVGLWLIASRLFLDSGAPRQFAFHPVTRQHILHGLAEVMAAVGFAGTLSGAMLLAAASLCLPFFLRKSKASADGGLSAGFTARALFVPAYFSFLLFSITFMDRATPLDARILLPASWCTIIVVFETVCLALRNRPVISTIASWALVAFFAIRGMIDTGPLIVQCKTHGLFLASAEILYDKNLKWVREELDSETTVYSNVSWSVYLACKRNVKQLTSRADYTTGKPNQQFNEQMQAAIADARKSLAIMVIDTAYDDPNFLPPTVKELTAAGLRVLNEAEADRFLILGVP
jgi:4-amino-4-deoxy-L-arabinose transferase-like glycosyltransferase